jgi:V/A-type H+-transporting ATPase subunit I
MFGMMFPDFGQGIVILLLGVIFAYVIKKPVVGMNMAKIGRLMIGLGISAIIFGLLMGEFFVTEVQPLWPGLQKAWITQPSNIIWIIKIAIFFGIAQIILAMSLSIWNHLKEGEKLEALLSEHGVAGIVTFLGIAVVAFSFLGVTIVPGVEFPQLGMGVLMHWIIAIPIIGLIAMFSKPLITGEGASMGFGIVLEAFISSLSNMFSYARIAGFAIAHAAFALVTVELLHANPLLGIGLGLIFLNFFSLTLELLVVMIQALRLLYYEFSTKFYKGTGAPYIPYRL